ncbi:TonB-dependent receptor plug domain-containing protein [Aestuariibacter salexigens]|uniref:TonB-dependent receptor plug domain-containing protein n=1 Tax=Aestuariibacter salexigens TaxID=226010 RepID=UPI0003FBE4D8|nr:TonB-dependent receptor [Aestuariibacter salexigens]
MTYRQLSVAAFVAMAACVHAEQAPETMTIIGSRGDSLSPYYAGRVDSLDRQDIEQAATLSLAELISSFAGMTVSYSGGLGSLTEVRLRGSESNHLLVVVDGVIINDVAQNGLVDFAHLSLAHIERIELLRGPQSSMWGSGAVAGVLNITTREPQSTPQKNLSFEAGEQRSHRLSASMSSGNDQRSYVLSATSFATQGNNIASQGDEDDGYRQQQLSGRLHWQPYSDQQITLTSRLVNYHSDFDGLDYINTGLPVDADNVSDGEQVGVNLRWLVAPRRDNWRSAVELQLYQHNTENIELGRQASYTKGRSGRVNWTGQWAFNDDSYINLLAEYAREDFIQRGPVSFADPNQRQRIDSMSLAFESLVSLSSELSLTLSARSDDNDVFNNANSYRVGLTYQLGNSGTIYVSRAKAIKNPSFLERFGYYPTQFVGNPSLTPEQAISHEAGINWRPHPRLQFAISVFDSVLQNEINGFVFDPAVGQFTAQNVQGESHRQGFEIALRGDWRSLNWRASYSYIDATQGEANITELRRARHQGALAIAYRWYQQRAGISVQLNYNGSRLDTYYPPYPANPETTGLPAYSKVHLKLDYRVSDNLQLNLGAENLLDTVTQDIVGFNSNGRRAYVDMRYTW